VQYAYITVLQRIGYILADSFTAYELCVKVANLVLCGTVLLWFPYEVPLLLESCRNIQCDIITQISKEECYAFCWLGAVKWLSTVHGMNCVKLTSQLLLL
jgi:hypothetical protein